MTFEKMNKLIVDNHIPADVEVVVDSNWDGEYTPISAAYYNSEKNILVLVHRYNEDYIEYDTDYTPENGWKPLYSSKDGACYLMDNFKCDDSTCQFKEVCENYEGDDNKQ